MSLGHALFFMFLGAGLVFLVIFLLAVMDVYWGTDYGAIWSEKSSDENLSLGELMLELAGLRQQICQRWADIEAHFPDFDYNAYDKWRENYPLNPPLSEKELKDFEREHAIRLPKDYRLFLKFIGNGSVESGLGRLVPLREALLSGVELNKSFPYADHCHFNAEADPRRTPGEDGRIVYLLKAGFLLLKHTDCGYDYILVVKGRGYGKVWRADLTDFTQHYHDSSSFCAWYGFALFCNNNFVENWPPDPDEYEGDDA